MRLRADTEFGQKLITVIDQPRNGDLPTRKSFLRVTSESVQLSAFRKKNRRAFELRAVEVEGQEAPATVELALPVAAAVETNLLGNKVRQVPHSAGRLSLKIEPRKTRTFELT